jgi:hypothetical protein
MQKVLLARESQEKDGKTTGSLGLSLNEAVPERPLWP